MRIACVLITHLRAKAELRRHAHLKDNSPIAVVDRASGKPLVVDSSAGASARAGMTLEQAISSHNGLIILDADEPYYRRVFEDVTEALLQVGDRVEPAELGTAYARMDGLESLYGGEEKARCATRRRSGLAQRACRRGWLEVHIVHSGTDRRCAKCRRLPYGRSRLPSSPVHRASAAVRGLQEVAARLRRPHDGTGSFSLPRHAGRPLRTRGHSGVGVVPRHRQASGGSAQSGDIDHGICLTSVLIDLHRAAACHSWTSCCNERTPDRTFNEELAGSVTLTSTVIGGAPWTQSDSLQGACGRVAERVTAAQGPHRGAPAERSRGRPDADRGRHQSRVRQTARTAGGREGQET